MFVVLLYYSGFLVLHARKAKKNYGAEERGGGIVCVIFDSKFLSESDKNKHFENFSDRIPWCGTEGAEGSFCVKI